MGHTKNEVDQAGGIISKHISAESMMSPASFLNNCENAMQARKENDFDMRSLEFCVGCPSYSSAFADAYGKVELNGIHRVQEARFALHPTEDRVEFHFRTNA